MSELSEIERAVEELHEVDRVADLLVMGLTREHAPPSLIEQAQHVAAAVREWQEQ